MRRHCAEEIDFFLFIYGAAIHWILFSLHLLGYFIQIKSLITILIQLKVLDQSPFGSALIRTSICKQLVAKSQSSSKEAVE